MEVIEGALSVDVEVVPPTTSQAPVPEKRHKRAKPGSLLTARELEVMKMLAEGMTVKRAADKLGLSPKTIDVHKTHLMSKLDIHNRVDLVKYAIRNNIISL